MPTNRAVTDCNALDSLRGSLIQARRRGVAWPQIAKSFPGVKIGTLKRIAWDSKYSPKRPDLCARLGLPVTAPAPICPRHGVVHRGRCPRPTFAERASEYDSWRAANAGKIEMIVRWSEEMTR